MNLSFYCRKDRVKKNGLAPIEMHLRALGGKKSKQTTGIYIDPKFFDNDTQKVKVGAGRFG